MLHNALKALSIGEVFTANSNEEALNVIKRLNTYEPRERLDMVDFVLCDLEDTPIGGIDLLRWVRMHRESPNRFLPVVLMANAFEPVDIKEARGFGATHFLVKPVTVDALADRLLTVINRPRQFIFSPTYFGPDRRGADKTVEDERRALTDLDVLVIRTPLQDNLDGLPRDGLIRYFRPPNHLKSKSGISGKKDGVFTEGAVDRARREVRKTSETYLETAAEYVTSLSTIVADAAKYEDRGEHFYRINNLANQFGLQGETFGYPLLTMIGHSLSRFTSDSSPNDQQSLDLVKAHIDSLNVVLRNKIAGDGGAAGKELVDHLQAAIKQITAKADA